MKDFVDLSHIPPDGYATGFRNQLYQKKLLFKREARFFQVRQNVFERSHDPSPFLAHLNRSNLLGCAHKFQAATNRDKDMP